MIGKLLLPEIQRITKLEIEMRNRAIRRTYIYNGEAQINDKTSIGFIVHSAYPIFLDEKGIFFEEPTPKGNGSIQIYHVKTNGRLPREKAMPLEDAIKQCLIKSYESFMQDYSCMWCE